MEGPFGGRTENSWLGQAPHVFVGEFDFGNLTEIPKLIQPGPEVGVVLQSSHMLESMGDANYTSSLGENHTDLWIDEKVCGHICFGQTESPYAQSASEAIGGDGGGRSGRS